MATAPTGDHIILTPDDAADVFDELVPAQNQSFVLGLKLGLPLYDVDNIFSTYSNARDRLLHILIAFLRQVKPRPTWRVIVDALMSHAVNLPQLAEKVEAAHFPDPTSTRDAVPETTVPSPEPQTEDTTHPFQEISDTRSMSSREVQMKIVEFDDRFNNLKNRIRECLEKSGVAVKQVADALTSLPPDDEKVHKLFLEEHVSSLFKAANNSELFGTMNFHWNYLNPHLLNLLIIKFKLKVVKSDMETYQMDLKQFRMKTPLKLFCRTQKRKLIDSPPGFSKVVAEFNWSDNPDPTLEDVEQFRQTYAHHYSLRDFSMMLAEVQPGCFVVTWCVPESVIDKLKGKVPRATLKKHCVTKLDIAGTCVYRLHKSQPPASNSPPVSSDPATGASAGAARPTPHQGIAIQTTSQQEEECLFVEQPSDDLFCPVTFGLLLKPHLTLCCGNHLSQEAAARIQGEGGACPLCKMLQLSTVLNKHFQRQVNELGVFCRHEDQGCGWQGELSDLERHVQSCPMRDQPLMTESEITVCDREERLQFQLTVQCRCKKTAPCEMIRGSSTTDCQYSYFTPDNSNSVYSYQWSTEKWEKLPPCPYHYSALVIINGELTAVGGRDRSQFTNKLFTFQQRQWVRYCRMKSARSHTAVVSTFDGKYIIAIGGYVGGGWTATVELFQVSNRRWNKLTNIPQPLPNPSATICGNQLHVIGGDANGYSCSLQALLSSDRPITSQSIPHLISWTSLPRLPVTESTAATFSGQLVIIGGLSRANCYSIHQLLGGQWVEIGSMSCGRLLCLVVSPSPDKMMIVGGVGAEDSVEEYERAM